MTSSFLLDMKFPGHPAIRIPGSSVSAVILIATNIDDTIILRRPVVIEKEAII